MERKRLTLWLLLIAVIAVLPQYAWGQDVTAAITGKVSDPSGAAISGASVTAKDTARGTSYSVMTNLSGVYNLPRVPVGNYEVRVEAKGFQTAVRPAFTLELNQTARLDFDMKIGQVSETVEVTNAAPLLQTENTQVGTVIDSQTNTAMALPSRNYIQLTLLAPGAVTPNPQSFTTVQDKGSQGRPYVNGNREQANNFLLDGLDNNQVSDNLVGYQPSPDAIQEFNLITQNASAEFGNFEGGIISTSIKSGTNQFHGVGYEFYRNDSMSANKWSNNFTNTPISPFTFNDFGGTLGGPVKKDRLFFFIDYEGSRYKTPSASQNMTVLTAKMRNGDFSEILPKIQLYDPLNLDASGKRVPFSGNLIPSTRIDPVAKALFSSSFYPAPENGSIKNNVHETKNEQIASDQGDAKVDWNPTDKDRLFVRLSKYRQDHPNDVTPIAFASSYATTPAQSAVINWTRTISPSFVNEVRAGWNYTLQNNGGSAGTTENLSKAIGINGIGDAGLVALNILNSAASNIGNSNNGPQQFFANTVQQYADQMIITRGAHIFHTGFQFTRYWLNIYYAGNNGRTGLLEFGGKYTSGPAADGVASNTAGYSEADLFLGYPVRAGKGVVGGTWGHRASDIAFYLQDDWRVNSQLTLNLGLRYQNRTPWVEVKDRQANFSPFTGAVLQPGKNGASRALYNSYNMGWDWQPRLGFAYTPVSGLVVRGAFTATSYLEGTGTNLRLTLNPPFSSELNADFSPFNVPPVTTANAFSSLAVASDPYAHALIRLWDPNVRPTVALQYNLSVQKQFSNDTTVQVGYVGQKGTHLMVPMPYFQSRLVNGQVLPSPYLSGNPSLYNDISQISGTESNGNMTYNALQAVLKKRMSGGLQYQVAYTYSKCMTNSSGYYGSWGGQVVPTSPYWQNLYDEKAEWGPCYYDVTQTLSAYAIYDIPVGKGKKLGNSWSRPVDTILGNWQLSGNYTIHGGFPTTIGAGDATGTQSRGSRASCVAPNKTFGKRNAAGGGYLWFDPASYDAPAPGTFGTCAVGTARGPGLSTLNLSVFKEFPIAETKRFQFRAESQNITNTPILNAPNNGLGSQLGVVNDSQGPRVLQIGIKFYY